MRTSPSWRVWASAVRRRGRWGHLPIAGVGGSLEPLATRRHGRTAYIVHINNTNPVLIETSPARRAVEARGIEVAVDGMEIEI